MEFVGLRFSAKLNFAFAVLIAAFLISSGIVHLSLKRIDAAATASESSLIISGQADVLLTQVLEQTNALRGFVLKGEPKFAATYQEAKLTFDKTLDAMDAAAPSQESKAHVQKMREAMQTWRSDIGDKVIRLMQQPSGQAEAANLSGVKSLTAIRAIQAEIREEANAAAVAGRAERARAGRVASLSILLGGLGAVAIAVLMGWILSRTIAAPVSAMTGIMRRLAKGDNDVAVPGVERKDEVGEMAGAVLSFKTAALEKLRLQGEATAAGQAAEVERARNAEAAEIAAGELAVVVAALGRGLARLSGGDLTFRVTETFAAQYRRLQDDFNGAMDTLQQTMAVIRGNARGIERGVAEIAHASDDLARRTEQQAASLEEAAAALDEVTATVRQSAGGADAARNLVSSTKSSAGRSSAVVLEAVEAMNGIETSSKEISQIIGVIDEIAFQTNLLALNAGVEAARAGDAGRGFAVVAQEVRALAQRSAEAAKEIKTLISTSSDQVGAGVQAVGHTSEALTGIVGQVDRIDALVGELAASAQQQAEALHQVNAAVNQMDQITQQNAAMVEEATAASHALSSEAEELARLVGQFEVGAVEPSARNLSGRRQSPATADRRVRPQPKAAAFG